MISALTWGWVETGEGVRQGAPPRHQFSDDPGDLAGVEGIEPSVAGIKIRCLTAWLHP